MKIGLQFYTLRNEFSQDFTGTMEKAAEIGYTSIELAGYGNMTASEMKSALDRLHLTACGSHVGLERLQNNLEEEIEFNLEIGNRYIVLPWAKFDDYNALTDLASFMNKAGEKIKNRGLQLCYHNHAHEFIKFGDEYGMDVFYKLTDVELVQAEFDTYWVQYAGLDPIAYIKKYAGRVPLVHQKDMDATEQRGFAELGNGIMDIKGLWNTAIEIGADWFIVEQDVCNRPALESIKISLDYLKKTV